MSASHLGNTPLDIAKLRDVIRKRLPELLDTVRGKKGLILDPQLTGPLSLIAEIPLLKDHGVEKIYHLDENTLDTDCKSLIYICRPKLKYMKYIAAQIRKDRQDTSKKIEYSLFFVPQRTMLCERVLEEEGVLGDITLGEFAMDWIPFEDDLISMELDNNTWKELNLDGDTTAVHQAAKSLMKLQQIYGLFPRIIGKGDSAKTLADMLVRMRREQAVVDEVSSATSRKNPSLLNSLSTHIDQLVIIDRNVDLYTPLCTQLTYQGLIDEIFGIKHSFVELDPSLVGPGPTQPNGPQQSSTAPATGSAPAKKKNYALNSGDKLFSQLCDLNFAVVGGLLNKIAKRINENYEERHQAKTMAQIRTFVGKLPDLQQEHQSLRTHTGIAEQIMSQTITDDFNRMLEAQQNLVAGVDSNSEVDYIEELIDKQEPIVKVLRVLCLMSLVQGGIKAKVLEHFKREIIQTYGYQHIQTLYDLERLGLFNVRTSSNASRAAYANVRRTLRLIVNEVDEHNPADISYVYSGYAPLSIRLVQCAVQKMSAGNAGGSVPGIGLLANVVGGGSSATVGSNQTYEKGGHSAVTGWKGYEEVLKLLPGAVVDEVQTVEAKNEREAKATAARAKRSLGSQHKKTTIVFFLGGCTYTEVSAIRFLAQQDEGVRDYLVATTQMINGSTLLESVVQTTQSDRADTAEVSGV
ncbi:Vacuolar protein-sorting-associated protein 33 [Umbelopsis nana]